MSEDNGLKDFDAIAPKITRSEREGPRCKLKGRVLHFLPEAPPWTRYSVMAATTARQPTEQVAGALDFMRGVIAPEHEHEFEAIMRDKHDWPAEEQIIQIFNWLLEEYVKPRPTQRPSGSSPGATSEPDGSEDGSVSKATTRKRKTSEIGST